MKFVFGMSFVIVAGLLAISDSAPGIELDRSAASTIVGGEDCGESFTYNDEIQCPDEVKRCNDEDVNCNNSSYEGYESGGENSGDRKSKQTTMDSCVSCGIFYCSYQQSVLSHVPADCDGG